MIRVVALENLRQVVADGAAPLHIVLYLWQRGQQVRRHAEAGDTDEGHAAVKDELCGL